jgi:hypothetical protein
MISRQFLLISALTGVLVFLSACSAEITRNDDGSLTVDSSITEQQFSEEVALAIEDRSQVENVSATLNADGTISVSGERTDPVSGQLQQFTFDLVLGVSESQRLSAEVTNFTVNGHTADDARLARWNENIAKRIEGRAARREGSTLQSVSVTDDALSMVWHVETKQSQGE